MDLSPHLYHHLVRPKGITQKYIHKPIQRYFKLEGKKVLDFGCGTGANSILCKSGHYYGTDPDQHRIQFAKRLYPDYHFGVLNDEDFKASDQSFDFILIVAVLHHIPPEQIDEYIKTFKRLLNPEGIIIVMEPYFSEKSSMSNWFMNKHDQGDFIQNEERYLNYFYKHGFNCKVLKRFKKLFLYNELFFCAY